MVDLHLPGPSGATLRVWPGGTRSLRLSWPTGQLPSGTWRLVAAGLDLTGTVDGDVVSWALTVDQVRAVLGQRWAVWCSTATDHPVLAGQVLEQRPLPGAGDGVSVEVAVVDGDPVVVEVGGPGGGLSEVEVLALIDAALPDQLPATAVTVDPADVPALDPDGFEAAAEAQAIAAGVPPEVAAEIAAVLAELAVPFLVKPTNVLAALRSAGGLAGVGVGHAAETTGAHGGIVADDDPRLDNARTPTGHAASHAPGGSDPITIDATGLVPATRTLAGLDLTTDRTAPALRSALGVVPGVDVQPADSDLTAIASLDTTSWGRSLLTLADAAAARTALDAAATGHVHDASAITTGVVAAARLGSGVASVGTVLSGAGTWTPRGYRLISGQPYDGAAVKSGTAVTTQNRVAWTTLEGLALGAQVDALWVDVVTGGSTGATVQLSLLADDGFGRPGALLAQTAQLPAETSTAIVMGAFAAVALPTSTIHIGVHVRSTAQPTLRVISSRATCIPAGGASTSNTMAWSSTIAGVAVGSNPAVDVSSAACYRAGIRGA